MAVATAPEAPEEDASHESPRPRFVLVGGVPGAGKTFVLDALTSTHPGLRSVDPDRLRRRFAGVLPDALPYRSYRAVVHLCAAALVLVLLLLGPTRAGGTLVVHDPATRRRRRSWTGHLARRRGWEPVLVVVDVSRAAALAGQRARRRVLAPGAFERHWQRWQQERPRLVALSEAHAGDGPWTRVHVVDRGSAEHTIAPHLG